MTAFNPESPPLGGPKIMRQKWRQITFVHWAVDPARAAPLLPRGTHPDVLDGVTYVGLIPFEMREAGFGRGPAVPYLGDFAETNVRLYSVDGEGRHGVVFRSLESSRLLVALGARTAFATPYTWARMRVLRDADRLTYTTRRRWPGPYGASSDMRVRLGPAIAEPSALEDFVTARFGLHTRHLGRTYWIPNQHERWPLQRASLEDPSDELVAAAGLPGVIDGEPASVLFSEGIQTSFGMPITVKA